MRKLIVLACLGLFSMLPAVAQEVIMNQPSADVVAKGHLFVRSDSFYTQHPAYFFQQVNFAYGVGHVCGEHCDLEVSLNTNDLAHGSTVYALIPGAKFAWHPTASEVVYVGTQYWKPVGNLAYHNGVVTYEAYSVSTRDFRFTAGAFQSHNAYALGNRAGMLAGIEWTMKKFKNGWALAPGIDWASGAGTNGYTSPGLNITKGNFFLCPGYMIGNPHNLNGAHQSFVMIGYTF